MKFRSAVAIDQVGSRVARVEFDPGGSGAPRYRSEAAISLLLLVLLLIGAVIFRMTQRIPIVELELLGGVSALSRGV